MYKNRCGINMKKQLSGIVLLMLVMLSGFSILASANGNLVITGIEGTNTGCVFANVENIGTETITNVSMHIAITYGFLGKHYTIDSQGITITPNMGYGLGSLHRLFGIGRISIYVQVSHKISDLIYEVDDTKTADGFIFFHHINLQE